MMQTKHIEPDQLALFAMELLTAEEARAVAEHLAGCAICQDEAAALRGDLSTLALSVEVHTPPAEARNRLLKQIGREKKIVPMVMPTASASAESDAGYDSEYDPHDSFQRSGYSRGSLTRMGEVERPERSKAASVLPWLGWAVAAGFAITAGSFYQQNETLKSVVSTESARITGLSIEAARGQTLFNALTDQNAMRVTLTQTPEKPKPQARAIYVPEKGTLLFTATNMQPLDPYKTYELWLIPADGHDPIPAGTFQPDARGDASVILPQIPKGVIAKAFGVTIEDAGGSLQPTLPIIMVGA